MEPEARAAQLAIARAARKKPSQAKMEAAGIDWVCEQLEEGRSQRSIARELGVDTMSLNHWLHDNPLQSARAQSAIEAGAEKHEADAYQVLQDTYEMLESAEAPHPHASALAQLAKERAQASWRMAGVRSKRYADHKRSEVTVQVTHSVEQLPTAELERLVALHRDTLQLEADGTVTGGGTSDSSEAGE